MKNGIWARTLASGASLFEMVVAKFLLSILMMLFVISYSILHNQLFLHYGLGDLLKLNSFTVLNMLIGALQGIVLSIMLDNEALVSYTIIGLFLSEVMVGNVLW
jgi:hypothetical protein